LKVLAGIFRVLSWGVYAVIILSLLVAAPIVFGYRSVIVLSGSMEPAYPVGSVIYYKAADFDNIAVGDVITFGIGENALATHRVVRKNEAEQSFVTKGDSNPSEDMEPVAYSAVVGKTANVAIPYAGYFAKYIQNMFMIVIMGVILLVGMLVIPDKRNKILKD